MTAAAHAWAIRPARWEPDFLALHQIDRGVRAMYGDVGVVFPPPGSNTSVSGPGLFDEGTMTWVATDGDDVPVGYVFAFPLDVDAFVDQLSVHPDNQRQGVGTALLDTVSVWAGEQGLRALTLTTYTDVPWNAPWYRRIGFADIPEAEWSDGLRQLLKDTPPVAPGWRCSVMQRPVAQSA